MPQPHIIRLRGPWKYRVVADDTPHTGGDNRQQIAGVARTTRMFADLTDVLGVNFRGKVRLTRHFHEPTGLDSSSRIDLVIDSGAGSGVATLNGELLGKFGGSSIPVKFAIAGLLRPRNELVIDVDLQTVANGQRDGDSRNAEQQSATNGGIVGEVRLEIR